VLHIGSIAFLRPLVLEDFYSLGLAKKSLSMSRRNQHPLILKCGSSDCNCFSPASINFICYSKTFERLFDWLFKHW